MIYITGASGFVGSHLCKKLDEDHIAYKKMQCGLLSYPSLLKEMKDCGTVVHLAALKDIEEGEQYPFHYFQNNVEGTFTLVKAAEQNRVKQFVFASSLATKYNRCVYGLTKLLAETIVTESNISYKVNLRFASIFDGEHGTIALFNKSNPIKVYGDGMQIRDFVHVSDAVEAILSPKICGTFDVGSTEITVRELAELYDKPVEYHPEIDSYPRYSASYFPRWLPDWQPKVDVREYVKGLKNGEDSSRL